MHSCPSCGCTRSRSGQLGALDADHTPESLLYRQSSSVDNQEYQRATWTGISGDRLYQNARCTNSSWWTTRGWRERASRTTGPLGALYPRLKYIMERRHALVLRPDHNGLGSHISPSYGGWGGRYVLPPGVW